MPDASSVACASLLGGKSPIGLLVIWSDDLEESDVPAIGVLANQTAIAIENARLFDEISRHRERLRAVSAKLAEAEESERIRLAQELHDQVGQSLTALGINLNIVRALVGDEEEQRCSRLDDSMALVEQTAVSIRGVMTDLRPPLLDDYGLVSVLRWYGIQFAARTDAAVAVLGDESRRHSEVTVETALFRIAQEALANVAKHANATHVTVTVEADDDILRMIVADDGVGFDRSTVREANGHNGWGLITMAERAAAAGGLLHRGSPSSGHPRHRGGAAMSITVLLADDHAVVCDGLRFRLDAQEDIEVVGDAANGREALRQVTQCEPDVAVMDIAMPEMNGIEATRLICQERPLTWVAILSMHSTAEHIYRALQAGARGYLLRESAGLEVVNAVRAVHSGKRYLSQRISDRLVEHYVGQRQAAKWESPVERLTDREREILTLVVEGKSSVEIADMLCVSPKTVDTCRSHMMKELQIDDIPGLVKFAIKHGLTTLE